MPRSISAASIYSVTNILSSFFAKTFERGDLTIFAGFFQLFDGFDSQRVMQYFDFFGADPWNFEHRHQARWCRRLQLLVIGQLAGGDQFANLLRNRIADAFDFSQALLADNLVKSLAHAFKRPRGIVISAR